MNKRIAEFIGQLIEENEELIEKLKYAENWRDNLLDTIRRQSDQILDLRKKLRKCKAMIPKSVSGSSVTTASKHTTQTKQI